MAKAYEPPANYDDMEGNVRQFTYVDHDIKPKISLNVNTSESDANLLSYRKEVIKEILALPAVSVGHRVDYQYLIERGEGGIKWNTKAVEDLIMSTDHVYFLKTVVWKNTVREQHWFDPMREDHEAIVRGDWRSLI